MYVCALTRSSILHVWVHESYSNKWYLLVSHAFVLCEHVSVCARVFVCVWWWITWFLASCRSQNWILEIIHVCLTAMPILEEATEARSFYTPRRDNKRANERKRENGKKRKQKMRLELFWVGTNGVVYCVLLSVFVRWKTTLKYPNFIRIAWYNDCP